MSIVLGLESYLPHISGVTIFTQRLATHLIKAGHEVSIVTIDPRGNYSEEKDQEGFFIYRLKGWPSPERPGLRVSSLWNRKKVRRLLGTIKPNVVHIQDPSILSLLLIRAAKQQSISIIAHHHFSMEFVLSYFKQVRFLHPFIRVFVIYWSRYLYNQCVHVVVPTEFAKRELARWGIRTPILVISNGIDLDRFKQGKPDPAFLLRWGIALEDKIVLYLGRLDKDKNLQTLVAAIPRVFKKTPQIIPTSVSPKFLFIGEGTERTAIEKQISRMPWRKMVRFLGPIPHEDSDIPQAYQAADVYWIASTIETQSITTLEAMASGLPIVAANAGALPEIVRGNQNGFLVDANDPEGFAHAITTIFANPELAARFGKESVAIASHHDVRKSFKRIEALYREVIFRE